MALKDKNKQYHINDLKNKVYEVSYNSDSYKMYKEQLEDRLLNERPDYETEILCIPSTRIRETKITDNMFSYGVPYDRVVPLRTSSELIEYFGTKAKSASAMDNTNLEFVPRYKAEYNPGYIQVVVAGYVYDKHNDSFILLNCKHGRMNNKYTMIQGHVDYSPQAYLYSFTDFLFYNMERELSEELNIITGGNDTRNILSFVTNMQLDSIITSREDFVDIEHMGVVFCIEIDSKGYPIITPMNEKHKHEVVKINLSDLDSDENLDKYDSWLIKKINDIVAKRRDISTVNRKLIY